MSYIVEKSVNSMLHSLVGVSLLNTSHIKSKHAFHINNISPGLQDFVEKLESAGKISKQEEEDYINKEYQHWLRKISTKQVKNSTIADILCQVLIAYSRGHRSLNFQIAAIKLTQCNNVYDQKIGSLYLSRTLSPKSDLTVLLVNSLQVQLNAENYIQIACGLSLIPLVANTEITRFLIQLVISCFTSQYAYIRKKAAMMVLVLCNSQYNKESLYCTFAEKLSTLLGDPEPSVVVAVILSMSEIIQKSEYLKDNIDVRNDIGRACITVIIQALNGKLPESYNFKKTVAPLVIVQMLRVLNCIAHEAWKPPLQVEKGLYLVLSQEVCDRSLGQCMSIIEAIHTAAAISSNCDLISSCLSAVVKFIQSSNIDFKYVGIKALTKIFPRVENLVKKSHVKLVMECLYDCNPNLQKKSLKLLMAMVGPQNYQDLCSAILEYCSQMNDKRTRIEVHEFLSNVVKDFDVDTEWCLKILPLIINSDVDSSTVITCMLQLISKRIILAQYCTLTCQDIIESLLKTDVIDLKTLSLAAALLSIQIRTDVTLVPLSLYTKFYSSLKKLDKFSDYDKEIIDCLVLCSVYETSLLSETKSILIMYLDKVDFLSSFKIQGSLDLLKNPEVTKNLFSRQTEIIRQDAIDLTLSFADNFINNSHKQVVPYCPSVLLESISLLNEKEKNILLTSSSGNSIRTLENFSLQSPPLSSPAATSIIGSFKSESPNLVWTRDGRKPVETSFEVVSVNVCSSTDVEGESFEMADEAAEFSPIEKKSTVVSNLDLMSKFLKGLNISD